MSRKLPCMNIPTVCTSTSARFFCKGGKIPILLSHQTDVVLIEGKIFKQVYLLKWFKFHYNDDTKFLNYDLFPNFAS